MHSSLQHSEAFEGNWA